MRKGGVRLNVFLVIHHTVRQWLGDGIFRRIFKNAGLMLGGRAATGLLSLATLSISARGLGVEQFGILVLVQSYAQIVTTLTTFQSCQALIRYGVISLEQNNTRAFQVLLKFATLLDAVGGSLGVAVGYFAAPLAGLYMGWSKEVVEYVQIYSVLILFTACATPTGVLRLFDRFDLLALQTTITPLFRLIGVAIAAALSAPFWAYLLAWLIAQLVGGAMLVYMGWREVARREHLRGLNASFKGLTADHGGILRFTILSNLFMALQIITGQLSIFLVGFLAGPSAAGIFKIGRDAATVLAQPAEIVNQSIYPEFTRLGSRGNWSDLTRLVLRGAAVATGGGAFMFALTIAFGSPILELFFGQAFTAAYLPLILLVGAAGLAIIGFPLDAALFAMGRAGVPLRISTGVTFVIYLPLLILLTRAYGPTGAGIATLAASALTLGAMTAITAIHLRRHLVAT